jgi:hypothetical protein
MVDRGGAVTLGRAQQQAGLWNNAARRCEADLPARSIFRLLHAERERLFPDELFVDVFTGVGRRSVPPSIVAVVMVLQRLEGLSDREAVDRVAFDLRWRYAAGVDDDFAGFVHTVLVDLRARLRVSKDPDRIFKVTTDLAREVGLVGVRRVLDSAPLFDAVATQDTVTLIRSAIRGLLRVVPAEVGVQVRGLLTRDDDYVAPGKPVCDWDDAAAREQLVDALVGDGYRALFALRGQRLDPAGREAAELLATVVGQDIEETDDGRFVIAQGVAADRVISVVDPQARHGHKTAAHGFDGYKGHIASDPDSELITAAEVSQAAAADAQVAEQLLGDLPPATTTSQASPEPEPKVYGDSAYGTGEHLAALEARHITPMVKVAVPTAPGGRWAKDRFRVDLDAGTVTCPAKVTVPIRWSPGRGGHARFGRACSVCPFRHACTSSPSGRQVSIHPHERLLAAARARQLDPAWQADYRAHRPKVERKLAHLLRRKHGGRRLRVRGLERAGQDWRLLAAAVNLARLAVLGACSTPTGWTVNPAT